MADDTDDTDDEVEGPEFDPYKPFSLSDWGSWKNYIAGALWNLMQIPRIIGGLISLGAVVMTFILFNIENFADYLAKLPGFVTNAARIVSGMLSAVAAVMNWSLPGWAIAYLEFMNSFLPLSEVFTGMSGIVGLYVICFVIRAVLKFTVLFR